MKALILNACLLSMGFGIALAGAAVVPSDGTAIATRLMLEESKTVEGKIDTVAEDNQSFTLRLADYNTLTLKIDKDTTYSLDGEKSAREKTLVPGRAATVTYKDGVASKVEVSTKEH